MKSRKIFAVLLAVFAFLLASCDGQISVPVSMETLLRVAETKVPEMVKVSIIIEEMDKDYSYDFLKEKIPSFENPHYVQYNSSTSLAFDAQVPVVAEDFFESSENDGFLFYIIASKNEDSCTFSMQYNRPFINSLNRTADNLYGFKAALANFEIIWKITNELSEPFLLKFYSSYVNEKPYMYDSESYELYSYSSVSTTFSEILRKSIADGRAYKIVEVSKN